MFHLSHCPGSQPVWLATSLTKHLTQTQARHFGPSHRVSFLPGAQLPSHGWTHAPVHSAHRRKKKVGSRKKIQFSKTLCCWLKPERLSNFPGVTQEVSCKVSKNLTIQTCHIHTNPSPFPLGVEAVGTYYLLLRFPFSLRK